MTTRATTRLECGLSVIHVSRPGSKAFYASLVYGTGSFHDPPKIAGATHFSEHLAFRGASASLWHELSALGVNVSATTGYEHTTFSFAGHIDHLPKSLSLIKSILKNEPCSSKEFLAEKEIFQHELVESLDRSTREERLDTHRRMSMGDPNWELDGDAQIERMKSFHMEEVESFRQEVFANSKAALAIATPWHSEEAIATIQDNLDKHVQRKFRSEFIDYPTAPNQHHMTLSSDPWEYVWIQLTVAVSDHDYQTQLTAWILAQLLGFGPHGLVFQKLRHEQSLAYDVSATQWSILRRTAINSSCSVPRSKVIKALKGILGLHDQLAYEGIGAEKLDEIKRLTIRLYEMEMDWPGQLVYHLAYNTLRKDNEDDLTIEDYPNLISELQLDELNATAAKLLAPENRYLFVGGRLSWLQVRRIRSRFGR